MASIVHNNTLNISNYFNSLIWLDICLPNEKGVTEDIYTALQEAIIVSLRMHVFTFTQKTENKHMQFLWFYV